MESKNKNSKVDQLQLEDFKPSGGSESISSTFSGRITCSMTKAGGIGVRQTLALTSLPVLESTISHKSDKWNHEDKDDYGSLDSATSLSGDQSKFKDSSVIMPVMTTSMVTLEEQVSILSKTIEGLVKSMKEQDVHFARLANKVEQLGKSSHQATTSSASQSILDSMTKNLAEASKAHMSPTKKDGEAINQHVSDDGELPINQLEEFILRTIKGNYEGSSKSSITYAKPYTKRIEQLKMPTGYQPPKFQQFNGKGNPKQHVAHFVETCNNAGTDGDLLVKQFVRTLKDSAFDWYCDLEAGKIDSWEQLEKDFLSRFFSTRRTVSLLELTHSRQMNDEPVVEYINRWRSLSLNCRDRLCETSEIEMCIQGMHWELQYILRGMKLRSFEDLASEAHNMEVAIATNGGQDLLIMDAQRGVVEQEVKKWAQTTPNTERGEAMVISTKSFSTVPVKISIGSKKNEVKKKDFYQGNEKHRLTLKEMEQKEYPFPDVEVPRMLEELLNRELIELPEMRQSKQADRVNDPNFCRYHRLVSHPTERCFVLKEKIVQLAAQGKILLKEYGVAAIHYVSEQMSSSKTFTIRFGSLSPVEVVVEAPKDSAPHLEANRLLQDSKSIFNEGSTVATSEEDKRALHSPQWSLKAEHYKKKTQMEDRHSSKQVATALRRSPLLKGVPVHFFEQDRPIYEISKNDHYLFDVCNCKHCLDDQWDVQYEDEVSKRRRNKGSKKSSQQVLEERYKAGDPEVGLLGKSSGKFDYYVLYPRKKNASESKELQLTDHIATYNATSVEEASETHNEIVQDQGREDIKIKDNGLLNDKVASTSILVLRYTSQPRKEKDYNFKGLTIPVTGFGRIIVKAKSVRHAKDETKMIEGFNPKVYKLFIGVGYGPHGPSPPGKLLPELMKEKLYSRTPSRCMLKGKGFQVTDSNAGLEFSLPAPYHLKFNNHYIFVEEDDPKVEAKPFVFDCMGEQTRKSAFNRLILPNSSIRERLSTSNAKPIARKSTHERLGAKITIPIKRRLVGKGLGVAQDIQASTDSVNTTIGEITAQQSLECCQAHMSKAFNKRVKKRSLKKGDLVLAVRIPVIVTHYTSNKFQSTWDRPYVVTEVYTSGAYMLRAEDGLKVGTINRKFLKRYYP